MDEKAGKVSSVQANQSLRKKNIYGFSHSDTTTEIFASPHHRMMTDSFISEVSQKLRKPKWLSVDKATNQVRSALALVHLCYKV